MQEEDKMTEPNPEKEIKAELSAVDGAKPQDTQEALPDKPWQMSSTETEPPEREKVFTEKETKVTEKPETAGKSDEPAPEKPKKRQVSKDTLLHMDYKLTFEQVYETFTLLGNRSRVLRNVQIIVLGLAAVVCLLAYFIYGGNYSFLLGIVVVLTCAGFIFFVPDSKRKKQAKKVMEMNPIYKLKLYKDGTLESPLQGKVKIKDDPKAVSFEGPTVFALGLEGKFSYCLPKEYLNEEETEGLRQVLIENAKFKEQKKLKK